MKKIYIQPEMEVVKIAISSHLLEASGTGIKGDAPEDAEGLSRQGRFWDEEDDE